MAPAESSRIAISELISQNPVAFLPRDDQLCVVQPFEVYLTYAQALPRRREELNEAKQTLADAQSLIESLEVELHKAENAKPRRARIIGPIRTHLQSAEAQRATAIEQVDSAEVRVRFSANTMQSMAAVLLQFGWRVVEQDGEFDLEAYPQARRT